MPEPEKVEYYQSVTLITQDGKRHLFMGPATLNPGDQVVHLEVTVPKVLPDDVHFGELEK